MVRGHPESSGRESRIPKSRDQRKLLALYSSLCKAFFLNIQYPTAECPMSKEGGGLALLVERKKYACPASLSGQALLFLGLLYF